MKSIISKLFILSIFLSLLSLGYAFAIPISGSNTSSLFFIAKDKAPDLNEFITSVKTGDQLTATGIFVENNFAFPIIQQPANDPGYIADKENVTTQFNLAKKYGTTGILAHNYLSGRHFSELAIGEKVILVFGDGTYQTFRITNIYQFQALEPSNPYSQFSDLSDSAKSLTSTELFLKIYAQKGNLVFQTCIQKGIDMSWGRLFLLATPVDNTPTAEITSQKANN